MIPQVGDHPVSRIAHQVGAEVVAHALCDRGGNHRQSPQQSTHCACAGRGGKCGTQRPAGRSAIGCWEEPRMIGPFAASGRSTWSKTGCNKRTPESIEQRRQQPAKQRPAPIALSRAARSERGGKTPHAACSARLPRSPVDRRSRLCSGWVPIPTLYPGAMDCRFLKRGSQKLSTHAAR